jgi:hypothetical protein
VEKLGESPFFFGEKPTYIDALVYGHLAVILHAPTSETDLNDILSKTAPKLLSFVERIGKTYFADELNKQAKKPVDPVCSNSVALNLKKSCSTQLYAAPNSVQCSCGFVTTQIASS